MNHRKKGLALTLALLLLLSELPLPALGAETGTEPESQQSEELTVEDTAEETEAAETADTEGEPEAVEQSEPETAEQPEPETAEPLETDEEPLEEAEAVQEPAAAEETDPVDASEAFEEPEIVYLDEDITYVNPLYRDILDENDLVRQSPKAPARRRMAKAAAPQENHYVTSVEEAAEIMRDGMKRRETTIRLYYRANEEPVWENMVLQVLRRALEHTGVPTEGDYLKWQYGGWSCPKEQNSYIKQGDAYDCTITYVMTYYSTAQEEEMVDSRIAALRKELGLSGKSDYEKIKAVYEYITETVTYDWGYAGKQSAGDFHPWSVYSALIDHTAVCQGYALLFYRLMLEEGIDCRVIFGYAGSVEHAWNIVKLDGVYYNLDPTQDAGYKSPRWFLKSDQDFPDHERGGQRQGDAEHGYVYNDAAFYAAYPMSETDYDVTVQKLDTPQLTDISSDYYGVELSWKPVSGAKCYRVWRKNQTGGWERVGETTHTSYLIPGVTVGEQYTFTVSCVDQQGESVSDRDEKGLSVLYALIYLQTPKLNAAYNDNGGVRVNWNAVPGGKRYRVYYRAPGGRWTNGGDANGTSYLVKGLTSGTRYTFTVRCVSDNGACFTSMYDPAGKTLTYLAAPEITAISAANGKVSLSWGKVAGAVQYRVFYRVDDGDWHKVGDTKETSFTSRSLTMGKTYRFTVRCLSADGKSYTSGYNSAGRLIDNVATPHIQTMRADNGRVSLTWGRIAGAAQYRVFYKVGSGRWQRAGESQTTGFTTQSLATGKTYRFTVRCLSADGRSYTSAYESGQLIANLATPTLKAVENENGGVRVSWNPVPGAGIYRVFYRTTRGDWTTAGFTSGTSFQVNRLKSGTDYIFTVRCVASDRKTFVSGYDKTGKRITYLAAPEIQSVQSGRGKVSLSWDKVPGGVNYRVFYKVDGGRWCRVGDTRETSYTVQGLQKGKEYIFTVRCISADGNSYTSGYNPNGPHITAK